MRATLFCIAILVFIAACTAPQIRPGQQPPAQVPPGAPGAPGCPGGSTGCPSTWNCAGTVVMSSGGIQCCAGVCTPPTPQCTNDAQCNDADSCTRDKCISNQCFYTPITPCCGNGQAEQNENCASCPADAGCPAGEQCVNGKCTNCGDGQAQQGENCQNCPADVKCPPNLHCVNGICMVCGDDKDCASGLHCCTIAVPGPGPFAGGAAAINKCLNCCIDEHCDDFDPCTTNKCLNYQCSYTTIPDCSRTTQQQDTQQQITQQPTQEQQQQQYNPPPGMHG